MRYDWKVPSEEPVVTLGSEIVYAQRVEWCGATWRPLCLSLMRTRQFFYYDREETLPVVLFLCGGGFSNVDRNVWMPELAWFAKRGFAVVSVDYSVTSRTRFPMQLEDVKAAIRFLRAHASEYRIDPDRIVVWGESAGGYLSALVGLTGNTRQYDVGEHLEQSSAVRGAVVYYAPYSTSQLETSDPDCVLPRDIGRFPCLASFLHPSAPPFLIFQGTADTQVPLEQGEALYNALTANGTPADLYVLEGAEHADAPFVQPAVKEVILSFLKRVTEPSAF